MTREQAITQMIETAKISISNDPTVPGFAREATLNYFGWHPVEKAIKLDFTVKYVGEGVPSWLSTKSVTLIADMKPLEDDTNEYEQFVNLAKNEIEIFGLIYDTIMLRDSQGKFNK
jgi:hypothetical protein